jgi:hypothetical protein
LRALWAAIKAGDMAEIGNPAFMQRVAKFEDSLTQRWKDELVELPLPKLWLDPVSQQPLKSPWLAPLDMDAQGLLMQLDPKLAEHFMRMAKDPWKYVAELRAAAARRKVLAGIEYNAAVHKTNPYVLRDDAKIAAFVASHNDEVVCGVYQWEAQPVRCFWSPTFTAFGPNRTTLGKVIQEDRELGLLLTAATKVEQELIDAEEKQLVEQVEDANKRIARLQAAR